MIFRIDYKEYDRKTIMKPVYTPVRFKTVFYSAPTIDAAEDLFMEDHLNVSGDINENTINRE